jgi:ATP:ADP antiporter, AAA family
MMAVAGSFVAGLHWFVHRINDREKLSEASLTGNNKRTTEAKNPENSHQSKLSLIESLRVLSEDVYLRKVATMVLAYGLTMEFTEIMWKAMVKKAFPVQTE